MITDFLTWTRENEYSIKESFLWSETETLKMFVHDTGILEVIPKVATDEQIVYSAGIHGNETAPLEILNDIISDIHTGKQPSVHHSLFIFGNPKAMNLGKRFVDENLNRLFARSLEDKPDNYDVRRAKVIIKHLETFYSDDSKKTHYDLHTAIRSSQLEKFAMYPFAPDEEIHMDQLYFLADSGIQAVIFGHSPATTFSYHSKSLFKAKSFTLELGRVKGFGENDRTRFTKIENSLRKILAGDYAPKKSIEGLKTFKIDFEILRTKEDFTFSFSESVPNFTQFEKDQLIATDGEELILAQTSDQRVLFPNTKVKIGERAAVIIGPKRLP